MSQSRLVYSTSGDNTCPRCGKLLQRCHCRPGSDRPAGDGIVRISRETKARGGKEVTVVSGLNLPAAEMKKLARELKARCGSGGSLKQDRIEIQGDRRAQVKALLEERRFQVKLAGG